MMCLPVPLRNNRFGLVMAAQTSYVNVLIFSPYRVNDEDVRLMLWDTAGQEEFDAITKAYYRGKSEWRLADTS